MNQKSWTSDSFLLSGALTAGDRMYAPGPPSWSPDGRLLAYVRAGGSKNQIWLHSGIDAHAWPISARPVLVEATDGTDRRDVGGGPQWSPDSRSIAFVGESAFWGARRTSIFAVDVETGAVRQLTNHPGNDRTPRWSPDGKWIAYVVAWDSGGEQVAIVSADGGTPIQLTYDRHANTDLTWSPDSCRIAFSSQRDDDALFSSAIGIVEVSTSKVEIVDHPHSANERTPRFSPDGRTLAFVSDRDGYDSLWLYDMQDASLRKLDVGRGEVAHPAWSSDGSRVAFALTDGMGCRIGVINVEDGPTTWWSPESGSAFWPAWSPEGNLLAYAWGDAVTPREIWAAEVDSGACKQVSSGVRGATDTSPVWGGLIRPERLTYAGVDGLPIDALLYRPPADKTNGSAILWVHGGPNWMVRDAYDPFLQYLVGVEGYTLFAPNVRGSTGYGRAYMDMNTGDYGGVDQDDWIAGVDVLVEQGGARRDRIAIWGRSYGGYATMMSLCCYPDTFRCGVAQFGVCDWHELWDGATPWVRRLMAHQLGHPQRDRALYRDRSPITHVRNIKAPILLLHGEADAGVPPAQSLIFAKALTAQKHPHELYVYPGEGHGFNEPHHVLDAARRITSFYDRYLRP